MPVSCLADLLDPGPRSQPGRPRHKQPVSDARRWPLRGLRLSSAKLKDGSSSPDVYEVVGAWGGLCPRLRMPAKSSRGRGSVGSRG